MWVVVESVATGTSVSEDALALLTGYGHAAVAAVSAMLAARLTVVRQRGWSDADLVHVVTRRLSSAHARIATGAGPEQGSSVREALRLLVEAVALVGRLPDIAPAGPSGGAERDLETHGLDARVLARVRGLLRKAESTTFPEEAEALTAKAQELIARHAIDALLVAGGDQQGQPSSRRVYLDDPYAEAKALLLDRVARANRCSAVYASEFGWSTVFGYDADLDAVELLTTSLLAQAAHALARHGSRVDASGRSRTKSFRRSFLIGFAQRIGERLQEATDAQVNAAGEADARLLPVLVARDERVTAARDAAYPQLVSRATAVSNGAGWVAGTAAADVADLSLSAGAIDRRRSA